MSSSSPVTLETERLVVTMPPPHRGKLLADYYRRNRRHLERWEPTRAPAFYTDEFWVARLEQNRAAFRRDQSMRLALFLKRDPRRIAGVVNCSQLQRGAAQCCALGYSLDAELEGQGLMHEALQATTTHAFRVLLLHRIEAAYLPENRRSERLLTRLGFERVGVARSYLFVADAWRDHVLAALVAPP